MAPRGTYRQIAEDLRRRIGSDELLPGAFVASEMALVEEYGVSRGTRWKTAKMYGRTVSLSQ